MLFLRWHSLGKKVTLRRVALKRVASYMSKQMANLQESVAVAGVQIMSRSFRLPSVSLDRPASLYPSIHWDLRIANVLPLLHWLACGCLLETFQAPSPRVAFLLALSLFGSTLSFEQHCNRAI